MFHFDVTAEDCRLIATESNEAGRMNILLTDNHSGKGHKIPNVTFCDLEKLISGMICCHDDVPAESYPHLEKLLEGCPAECRPIP